jgi:hypothetical protein
VSAVYKDLPPEAQANLKEALAALHKAWNRWAYGWWPVGKWGLMTHKHAQTQQDHFSNQPGNWNNQNCWWIRFAFFFPSSSLRTGIVIQKQFVCSTARKYQPENVNGARTRRLKNPQDPAFAINFLWNLQFCVPSAFV